MRRRTKLLIILSFAILLTLGRFVWYHFQTPAIQPTAAEGQLDARKIDFSTSHSIELNGDWKITDAGASGTYGQLPAYMESRAIGAYELAIQTGDSAAQYALSIRALYADVTVFANDKLVYQTPNFHQGPATPIAITDLEADKDGYIRLHVRFHAFHGNDHAKAMIDTKFGSSKQIQKETFLAAGVQFFVGAILFIHAVYAFVLYLMRPKKIGTLYFSIAVLLTGIAVVASDYNAFGYVINLSHNWHVRIVYFSYIGLSFFFLLFAVVTFTNAANKWPFRILSLLYAAYLVYILSAPIDLVRYVLGIGISLVIAFSIVCWILLRTVITTGERALPLFLAGAAAVSHVAWSVFVANLPFIDNALQAAIKSGFYPFDITVAFVCFCSFWFIRFFQTETENERYIEQLELEQKRKDQFLANTSHELRTPLHGMMNMAQSVIDQESKLNKQSKYKLQLIQTISRKMSYLLNDLIDVTQMKQNQLRLVPAAMQIEPLLIGTVDMLRFMAEEKHVEIHVDMPESLPCVYADEHRVTQIVTNMLHNALKFTPEGSIRLVVSADEKQLYVKVIDTGIGIDKHKQARIFIPYEKGDNVISESEGIGLGLGISKQLAEMHGGTLTVESELNKGSVFTLSLPLAADQTVSSTSSRTAYEEAASAAAERIEPDLARTAGRRILAIDDDAVNLMVLKQALEPNGYHIHTVSSPTAFLECLTKEQYDLLIIDVMMPKMSGFRLTEIVRQTYSLTELPILLLTARSQATDAYAGFRAGANEYVTKPIDMLELKTRINSLLELKGSIEDRLRMEAAWLQAQIHPHFLFNTLNTIASLSTIDTDRMLRLIQEFGNYLQSSFNGKNISSCIPLEEELDLVRSYLYIQQERFGRRLQVKWHIDRHVQFRIPPLTLQPLVENAVIHGLQTKEDGGTIFIEIFKENSTAVIFIKDDGVGIPSAKLQHLSVASEQKDSIGLLNTHTRLQKMNGAGLLVCSEEGAGTTIQIRLPIPRKNNEDQQP
ncbi:7TM diverse intracellular signalling [Terribacillus aidingensis]|uniref:histidine kinase n=1 Tax=Terribacillus aidingensis TaxID=586416 RepID=A0A285N5S7_9BACI|nr:ATP-binding protein [Terribacillus aidingensis]SNZ04678.1 7TM diverse intracellular signalling [Terribacillus aidingensis]